MKFIKWRILIISCIVCLLPILLGLSLWNELPDTMAIHFDINNTPDNFASKSFVVFGLPLLMAGLQLFCCFINDINAYKHGERKKFERVTKWIIPCVSVFMYTITIVHGMGQDVDIRKAAMLIAGIIYILIGNYLPKLDYIKHCNIDKQKARKINRFAGYEMTALGILFIVSMFLPAIVSAVCVTLIIPCIIIGVVYGIRVAKK